MFSAALISLLVGLSIGLKYQKSRFEMEGKTFVLTGVGQIDGNGKKVYVPVYEESKR